MFSEMSTCFITMLKQSGWSVPLDECTWCTTDDGFTGTLNVDGVTIKQAGTSEGFKVLGTQFTLLGWTPKELKCQIAAAWPSFHTLAPVLDLVLFVFVLLFLLLLVELLLVLILLFY